LNIFTGLSYFVKLPARPRAKIIHIASFIIGDQEFSLDRYRTVVQLQPRLVKFFAPSPAFAAISIIALEGIEPDAETNLIVCGQKFRRVANPCNGDAANGDPMIDDVREDRTFAG